MKGTVHNDYVPVGEKASHGAQINTSESVVPVYRIGQVSKWTEGVQVSLLQREVMDKGWGRPE